MSMFWMKPIRFGKMMQTYLMGLRCNCVYLHLKPYVPFPFNFIPQYDILFIMGEW